MYVNGLKDDPLQPMKTPNGADGFQAGCDPGLLGRLMPRITMPRLEGGVQPSAAGHKSGGKGWPYAVYLNELADDPWQHR